jgi:hypothetical protein
MSATLPAARAAFEMDQATAERILDFLHQVGEQRRLRKATPGLEQAVEKLKQYQQQRFRRSYADLLASARYRDAAQFFLDELYGPGDFTQRDAQFARVVPALVRLFPAEVVRTVEDLARLHATTERLDTEMARHLQGSEPDRAGYLRAWQACDHAPQRQLQIDLTLGIGEALDAYTRKPLLRQALRMMRGPARAAGLQDLQHFLECGFDTFKAMKGASHFLTTVRGREEALAKALFAADAAKAETFCPSGDDPLGQLP